MAMGCLVVLSILDDGRGLSSEPGFEGLKGFKDVGPRARSLQKRRHVREHRCHSERSEESHHGPLACRVRFFTSLHSE